MHWETNKFVTCFIVIHEYKYVGVSGMIFTSDQIFDDIKELLFILKSILWYCAYLFIF